MRNNMADICPSNEDIFKLCCSICSKYLSYFPIHSNADGSSICGRCESSSPNVFHNRIYELLAKNTRFPCIYDSKGCSTNLIPSSMTKHEEFCSFRQVTCINNDCTWSDIHKNLEDHLQNQHNLQIKKSQIIVIDLECFAEKNVILCYENKYYRLNIQIGAALNSLKFKFTGLNIFSLKSNTFFSKFRPEENRIKTSGEDQRYLYEIELPLDKKFDSNRSVIIEWKLCLEENSEKMSNPAENNLLSREINYEILDNFKCSQCQNYIVPPIFQCLTGHGICKYCQKSIRICPICEDDIIGTRNFLGEMILTSLNFPCPFQRNGCLFVDKPKNMKKHLKSCPFVSDECPLNLLPHPCHMYYCDWFGSRLKMYAHIKDEHSLYLTHNSEKIVCYLHSFKIPTWEYRIIKYCNNLFRLIYYVENNEHYWTVQYLNNSDDSKCKYYLFTIDIFDNSNTNQKLIMESCCAPRKEHNECFNSDKNVFVSTSTKYIKKMIGIKSENTNGIITKESVLSFYVQIKFNN